MSRAPRCAAGSINYTWDGGNRLTQIVDSLAGTLGCGYGWRDHPRSETTPQGTVG